MLRTRIEPFAVGPDLRLGEFDMPKLETLANSEIFEIKTIAHDDFAIALASTGSRTTRPDMLRSRNAQSASFAASKAKVVIGGA